MEPCCPAQGWLTAGVSKKFASFDTVHVRYLCNARGCTRMTLTHELICTLSIIPVALFVLIRLYHIWVKGVLRRVKCHAFKLEDAWILN